MTKFCCCSLLSLALAVLSHPAVAADLPLFNGGVYEDAVDHGTPHTAGYLQGGYAGIVDAPYDASGDAWSLKGSINFNPERKINIQADIGNAWENASGLNAQVLSWALHGYYRNQDFAFGAFFQSSRLHAGILGSLGDDSLEDYLGGLEAAYFIPSDTFFARLGFGQAKWSGYSADHLFGAIGVRHYFSDDLRLDVQGSFNHVTYAVTDIDTRSVNVTGNYRPGVKPITLFAGYQFAEAEGSMSGFTAATGSAGTVFGGMRISFGSNSLRDEERAGPMWSTDSIWP